jgi:epoxide hydrolase-like predicted phosphatase
MTLNTAFFDLGGVILRTEYQAPREHLAERLNVSYEDLSKTVFESESARQASFGEIKTDQHWAIVATKLGRPASEIGSLRSEFFAGDVLDRELIDFIRSLRLKHKTGLISNGWPDLRDYVVRNNFDDAFDEIVISAEVGLLKPAPAIYRLALERVQAAPEEAVFVDDSTVNVEAANAMGMRGILFTTTQEVLQELGDIMK